MMKDLSKLEISILMYLNRILNEGEKLELIEINELVETDEILKIRELVYHLDLLSQKEYVELEDDYYMENESVAFKYVNSAVSIDVKKIKLTKKTMDKLREHEFNVKPISERAVFTIFTYLLTFALGMMAMYIIK